MPLIYVTMIVVTSTASDSGDYQNMENRNAFGTSFSDDCDHIKFNNHRAILLSLKSIRRRYSAYAGLSQTALVSDRGWLAQAT